MKTIYCRLGTKALSCCFSLFMENTEEKLTLGYKFRNLILIYFSMFFVLFIAAFPNVMLFFWEPVHFEYIKPVHNLCSWFALNILKIPRSLDFNETGKGDSIANYIIILLIAASALLYTIICIFFKKSYTNTRKIIHVSMIIISYYLALTMVAYGIGKFFRIQFPEPSYAMLKQTYGNSTPMELAWTFFGYSKIYNYLMGFFECCSILLLFRRTHLIGALTTLFTALNIMAVNYCFDIPVKILSSGMVGMSLFILAPNIKRLIDFFILNKPSIPIDNTKPFIGMNRQKVFLGILKYLLISSTILYYITFSIGFSALSKKTFDLGTYNVQENSLGLPRRSGWQSFTLTPDSVHIELLNGQRNSFRYVLEQSDGNIKIFIKNHVIYSFNYEKISEGKVILHNNLNQNLKEIVLLNKSLFRYKLMEDGFHWISE